MYMHMYACAKETALPCFLLALPSLLRSLEHRHTPPPFLLLLRCRSTVDQTRPKAEVRDVFQAAKRWNSAQKRQLCRVAASSKHPSAPLCAYLKGAPSALRRLFIKSRRSRCENTQTQERTHTNTPVAQTPHHRSVAATNAMTLAMPGRA